MTSKFKEIIELIHRYMPTRDITITKDLFVRNHLIRVPLINEDWKALTEMAKNLEKIGCVPDKIVLSDSYSMLQFVLEVEER